MLYKTHWAGRGIKLIGVLFIIKVLFATLRSHYWNADWVLVDAWMGWDLHRINYLKDLMLFSPLDKHKALVPQARISSQFMNTFFDEKKYLLLSWQESCISILKSSRKRKGNVCNDQRLLSTNSFTGTMNKVCILQLSIKAERECHTKVREHKLRIQSIPSSIQGIVCSRFSDSRWYDS